MRERATAVLFDLDSTLADTWHRQHMVPEIRAGKATWDEYALACEDDKPIEGTRALMSVLWLHHQIHIISGRSGVAKDQTDLWLRRHGFQFDYLRLREPGDHRPNAEPKIAYASGLPVTVVLFVEDWKDAADKIQEATGIPVLLVNPGYPFQEKAAPLETAQNESSIL